MLQKAGSESEPHRKGDRSVLLGSACGPPRVEGSWFQRLGGQQVGSGDQILIRLTWLRGRICPAAWSRRSVWFRPRKALLS